MDSSESIRFDEYMEGGIPPHLLQGLGYSEAGRLEVDEDSSDEAERSCDEDNIHTLTGEKDCWHVCIHGHKLMLEVERYWTVFM